MRKRIGILVCTMLIWLLILNSFTSQVELSFNAGVLEGGRLLFSASYEEKLKDAQEKKQELDEAKKETEERIAVLKKEADDIIKYIEELDNQLNQITARLDRLTAEIAEKEEDLAETQILLEEAKQREAKQYVSMKKRIQYMYENGGSGILEILINSGSLSEFLNQGEYFSKIAEYDNNLLKNYIETKQLVAEREACLTLDLQSLNDLKEAAAFEKQATEELAADKNIKLAEYIEKIGINDELLSEYLVEITSAEMDIEEIKAEEARRIEEEERRRKEEEERLRKEEEERRQQNAAQGITTSDKTAAGDMIWPLPGDGRIFSYFGYRVAPTAGASTYHRGVDIGGETGANIVAVLAGTVEKAYYSVSGGNSVIIDHGNGLRTAYLHCSKFYVSVGDYVKQGQVIAAVGSTGVSTGPHLHFGVSVNGTYVDPLNYISYN